MSDSATTRAALALAVGANLPVLLWGAPGTGKTSAVLALAARLDLPVETVIGSIREPSDFSGLPVIRDEETRFAPPRWARRLAAAGSGLLFLDELTTAPPAATSLCPGGSGSSPPRTRRASPRTAGSCRRPWSTDSCTWTGASPPPGRRARHRPAARGRGRARGGRVRRLRRPAAVVGRGRPAR